MNLATVLRFVELEGKQHEDWENRWYIIEDYVTMAKEMGINFTAVLHAADIETLCANCDGLILPGSAMNINPKYYGGEDQPPQRDEYDLDMRLIDYFVRSNKPIFGICGGFQELNIYFGGTIKRHGHDDIHAGGNFHPICVEKDSFVWDVYRQERAEVNSYHYWQLDKIAPPLQVVAVSDDGIPEAVQCNDRNIFAVQWHPDRSFHDPRTAPVEKQFFANFISTCRAVKHNP